MSEDEKKPAADDTTSQDESQNSQAFDDLADGKESADPVDSPLPEKEEVLDTRMDEENFTESFAQNYETNEFSDADDFSEFETFDDSEFMGDEFFDDTAFEEPIDAEFSEFEETPSEDFADDWQEEVAASPEQESFDGADTSDDDFKEPEQKNAAQASLAKLNNANLFNYAVYGVVGLVGVVVVYFMLFAGGGSDDQAVAPIAQNTQSQTSTAGAASVDQPQTLSGILNSGSLQAQNAGQGNNSLLDSLDGIEQEISQRPTAKKVSEQLAQTDQVPVFEEKQSLGSLPSPTPLSNDPMAAPASAVDEEPLAPLLVNPNARPANLSSGEIAPTEMQNLEIAENQMPLADGFNDGLSLPTPFDSAPEKEQGQIDNTAENIQALEQIEQKAQQAQASQKQVSVASSASNAELINLANQLTDNIAKFETQSAMVVQRLDDMEQRIETASTLESDNTELMKTVQTLSNKVAALEKRLSQQNRQPRQASAASSSSANKSANVKPSTPVWELRAASPNQAWVSRKGNNTLKQVAVGDQLEGMGTIQSIVLDKGRWVVVASNGRLMQ